MSEPRTTYSFGPLERRGLLGAVTVGQLLVLAVAVLAAVAMLDVSPSAAGLFGGILICTLGAAVSYAPVAGRTTQEWAPIGAAFAFGHMRGRHRFQSAAPRRGSILSRRGVPATGTATTPVDVPPELEGVRIVAAVSAGSGVADGQPIGILSERGGRRLTAILACRVSAFALLDPEAQERRLARWGLVLTGAGTRSGTGQTAIRRLQWIERTAPAQGDELARWVHDERDPTVPLRGSAMIESYLELISSSTRVSQDHEVLLAVQVDGRGVRGRPGAGGRGSDPVQRALLEATERIAQGLEGAEVSVLGALGPAQIARTLRTAFDPFARAELAAMSAADPGSGQLAEPGAWPLAARETWDHYGADGALHATYWISGWPRVDVSPMFMDALLGPSGTVRTVAVTFEPLALDRSTREIEAAVTRDRADRELRARFGQSETARQRQAAQATVRREAELAAGHGEVRFTGFVTVSGRDEADLRRACSEMLEHASRARLELRRLYGQQAQAFTFTLPLCRGLR